MKNRASFVGGALAFSLLVAALPGIASAQAGRAEQRRRQLDEAARLTFQAAREAFAEGEFEVALESFQQAYRLSARPGLLYNIAQTLDRLRRDDEALATLRRYLEAAPDAPNRREVEARIRRLEAVIEERQQAQRQAAEVARRQQEETDAAEHEHADAEREAAAEAEVSADLGALDAEDSDRPPLHPVVFLSVAGLAVAAGGAALTFGLLTVDANNTYTQAAEAPGARFADVEPLYQEADSLQLWTNVFLITSGVAAIGGAVLAFFTDWEAFSSSEETSAQAASARPWLLATPGGAGAGISGHF